MNVYKLGALGIFLSVFMSHPISADEKTYDQARWDPIHFMPAIASASDEQCLECHREILERQVLKKSPAGIEASQSLAWYQTLHTYQGPQETFHRRHISTPLAKRLMQLKCNTCHQGNDPREEAPIPGDADNAHLILRKMVAPMVCAMCHGANNYSVMGLPSPWSESREMFQHNCLLCHSNIRTVRHQVNFLKPEEIEKAGKEDSDVCYGCHGGRAWYRIPFAYPRHAWPGASPDVPEWAKDRPTESAARFQTKGES